MATDNVCPRYPEYSAGDIIALVLCGILVLLVIAGTGIDVVLRSQESKIAKQNNATGLLASAFISFSVVSNLPKILNMETREGNIDVLNGIRILSILWVILGHSTIISFSYADNLLAASSLFQEFSSQAVINATISVDTFFFLGGLLVSFLTLKQLEKGHGRMNWFLYYFHRIWRLTPVYAFTIMISATLVRHMQPEGPVMEFLQTTAPYCQKDWWTNLLYINNFYFDTIETSCVSWGWYLANDMQFYIISPIIIIALYKKPWVGYALMSVLLVMCLVARGVVSHVYGISPVSTHPIEDIRLFDRFYIRPHYRISPYITGLALGYYLWLKKLKVKMSPVVALVGWALAIAVLGAVLYGLYGYYKDSSKEFDTALVVYQTFHRWAWSLGVAWIVLACVAKRGVWINTILSWRGWIPFVRLSYSAYLIHVIVLTIHGLAYHAQPHFDIYTQVYKFFGDTVMTYMASLVLVLALESPMVGLEKVLLRSVGLLTRKGAPKEEPTAEGAAVHSNGKINNGYVGTHEKPSYLEPQIVLVGTQLDSSPYVNGNAGKHAGIYTNGDVGMHAQINGGFVPKETHSVLETF